MKLVEQGAKKVAPMLRLDNEQPSLWESMLPPELFEMNEELTKIDRILDDERFFAPFREKFYSRVGRPTIPTVIYFRMMCLKRRYKLGYETLVKGVKEEGVLFIQYDLEQKPEVSLDGKRLKVQAAEPILGGGIMVKPDLVGLSPAIVPYGNQS